MSSKEAVLKALDGSSMRADGILEEAPVGTVARFAVLISSGRAAAAAK